MNAESREKPLVSVAMPVRDAEGTVEAAVDSLRRQTWQNLEIVVVDHDSSDGTPTILRRLADRDGRIRLLHENGSFVEAANRAWRESRGALVARMDADDIAHPERIESQVAYLDARPEIAACGTRVAIRKREGSVDGGYRRYERWVNSVLEPSDIAAQRFVDSPLPNPTALIRREALEDADGYADPPWAEDYDFWLRLLERGHRLGKVDRVLLEWYDGPARATRTRERYSLRRFQEAKACYLSRMEPVRESGVVVCGAGPIGKEIATLLRELGIGIHAFVEVNVRQIGNRIGGVPVVEASELPGCRGKAVALGAVGQPGAREKVRRLAREAGFREGHDFFAVA